MADKHTDEKKDGEKQISPEDRGARPKMLKKASVRPTCLSTPGTPEHTKILVDYRSQAVSANFDVFRKSSVYTSMIPGGPIAAWSLAAERPYPPERMKAVEVAGEPLPEAGAWRRGLSSTPSLLRSEGRRETATLKKPATEVNTIVLVKGQRESPIESSGHSQANRYHK